MPNDEIVPNDEIASNDDGMSDDKSDLVSFASDQASCHISVMPDEIVHWLSEVKPRVIVDGTYGGGGHSELLLPSLPDSSTSESDELKRDVRKVTD